MWCSQTTSRSSSNRWGRKFFVPAKQFPRRLDWPMNFPTRSTTFPVTLCLNALDIPNIIICSFVIHGPLFTSSLVAIAIWKTSLNVHLQASFFKISSTRISVTNPVWAWSRDRWKNVAISMSTVGTTAGHKTKCQRLEPKLKHHHRMALQAQLWHLLMKRISRFLLLVASCWHQVSKQKDWRISRAWRSWWHQVWKQRDI